MELLRKRDGNGVEYTDSVSDCNIYALTKSRQLTHPKTSSTTTSGPMDPVCTDLMGPFTPPAKGGYRFVTKYTDYHSRMKEVYLLRTKSEAAQSLYVYNMAVAVLLGRRFQRLRCDKGGEYIGQEFKTLCRDSGIQIEYTTTNTPKQNGVSERDGQTLAAITRCLLKDGHFPQHMCGGLHYRLPLQPVSTLLSRRYDALLQDARQGSRPEWSPHTPRSSKTARSEGNSAASARTARHTASSTLPEALS